MWGGRGLQGVVLLPDTWVGENLWGCRVHATHMQCICNRKLMLLPDILSGLFEPERQTLKRKTIVMLPITLPIELLLQRQAGTVSSWQ